MTHLRAPTCRDGGHAPPHPPLTLIPRSIIMQSARPSINPAGIQSAPAQQQQPVHTRPGNVGGDATTVGPTVGLNLRQDSLDVIASTELTRTKTMGGSQTLFADVLEQVC